MNQQDYPFLRLQSEEGRVVMEKETEEIVVANEESELSLAYRNKNEVIKSGVLGFFIGLAIIVPGISGSAIAIIFKLYEKLLFALGNIFSQFKRCILFLLPIIVGAIIGVALGFIGVKQLLNLLPFATTALFAGLMAGSFPAILEEEKGTKFKLKHILLLVIGVAIPIVVSLFSSFFNGGEKSLSNLSFLDYALFIAIGYAVAITQLVPGLSATAVLMCLGYFTPFVNSVSLTYWGENPSIFIVYACLALGLLLGMVTFSKALSLVMKKFHDTVFALITGLSLGSIISIFTSPDSFSIYRTWGNEGIDYLDMTLGIILFVIGIAISYGFFFYERKKSKAKVKLA